MYLLISDFLAFDNQKLCKHLETLEVNKMAYIASNFEDFERNIKYSHKLKGILEDILHHQIDLTIVDAKLTSSEMYKAICDADVIFLAGGDTKLQLSYIKQYALEKAILNKENIIGMSAGAFNLTTNIFLPNGFDRFVTKDTYFAGLGLLDLVVYPHYEDIDEIMYNDILKTFENNAIYFIKNAGYIYINKDSIDAQDCAFVGSIN